MTSLLAILDRTDKDGLVTFLSALKPLEKTVPGCPKFVTLRGK